MSFEKPKPKLSQRPVRTKVYIIISQWELKEETSKLSEGWGNAGDQVVIDVSFASDCLRGWREFSGPITEKSLLKI